MLLTSTRVLVVTIVLIPMPRWTDAESVVVITSHAALTHSSTNDSMLLVLHTSFNSAIFDTYKPCHQVCPFQGYERACHFPVGAQQIAVMERQPSINFLGRECINSIQHHEVMSMWLLLAPQL